MIGTTDSLAERCAGLMDEAAAEVFGTMLGLECVPVAAPGEPDAEVSARVEFSGTMEGCCTVMCADGDAAVLAELLLGGPADEGMIADAVGELCNMLAGGWKRRLGEPESVAGMSPPKIVRGELDDPRCSLRRTYRFDGARFTVAARRRVRAVGGGSV